MAQLRQQAVKAYQDPDQRGTLLQTRAPSGFAVFAVLAGVFVVCVVLAAITKVPVVVFGRGMVQARAGVVTLRAPAAGLVEETHSAVGDLAAAKVVLHIRTREHEQVAVVSPLSGTLDEIRVVPGEFVEQGQALATLVPRGELLGLVAFPARYRQRIQDSMEVRLHMDELEPTHASPVIARVHRVRAALLTQRQASELGLAPLSEEPQMLVEVDLQTVRAEVAQRFHHGMPLTAEVRLGQRSILELLFPAFE